MSIRNLNKEEIKEKALKAITEGNTEEQADVMQAWMEMVAEEVAQKVSNEQAQFNDDTMILTNRGVEQLTSEEVKYFEKVSDAMKEKNVRQALTDIDVVMPTTTINRVFEDLEESHPLLSKIKITNVTGVTETIKRNGDVDSAWWGSLCEEIKKELEAGFKKESTTLYKLSAFLPICKAYLVLGPAWLEKFIRTILTESIKKGLVSAIVSGTGVDQPLGMDRDLTAARTPGEPVPQKEAIEIADFEPATLGAIIAKLTNNGKRAVTNVILIVNPVDYWTKVWPLTTTKNALGQYIANQFPLPVDIIQETTVAQGKAIIGLADKYDLNMGMNQKIEYSDEFRFLDDERVYITKLYANGGAVDNNSFEYLDISKVNENSTEIDLNSLTKAQLLAMAEDLEVTGVSDSNTKSEIIVAIKEALNN